MIPKQFFTSQLLVLMAYIALVARSDSPTNSADFARHFGAAAVVAAAFALRYRTTRPHFHSAVATLAFFACCLGCWWVKIWLGYFTYRPQPNARPYFDDGMIGEGFVYPFVYFIVYGPVYAAFAFFISAPTAALANQLSARMVASR